MCALRITLEQAQQMGLAIDGNRATVKREGKTKPKVPTVKSRGEELFAFQVKGFCLPTPVYDKPFHDVRKWRFDVAWWKWKVALEVDGGIWREGGGAHSNPQHILRDIAKGNAAQLDGWIFLRVTPDMVKTGEAIQLAKRALALRGWEPGPEVRG